MAKTQLPAAGSGGIAKSVRDISYADALRCSASRAISSGPGFCYADGMTIGYGWHRSGLVLGHGEIDPDDWCLCDGRGRCIGRVYSVRGGPHDGWWVWFVLADGRADPDSDGSGYADTEREAKDAVEARALRLLG